MIASKGCTFVFLELDIQKIWETHNSTDHPSTLSPCEEPVSLLSSFSFYENSLAKVPVKRIFIKPLTVFDSSESKSP